MNPTSLFSVALDPQAHRRVAYVACDRSTGRIELQVAFARGARFVCPYCGAQHQPVHDIQEREWRHLNCFQFEGSIHAKVPRVRCAACAKTTQVLGTLSRCDNGFTQLMEALIVTLCQAMPVRQVAPLLGVGNMRLWRTLDYYVEGARAQEDFSVVVAVGLYETAARYGHPLHQPVPRLARRAPVVRLRGPHNAEVVAQFADDLDAHGVCAENVRNLCIDMPTSYRGGVAEHRIGWRSPTMSSTLSNWSTRVSTRSASER